MWNEKYFATKDYWKFSQGFSPVFRQYNVICCAFFAVSFQFIKHWWDLMFYGWQNLQRGKKNLFFFWRWGKGEWEKLFCKPDYGVGFSGLQMCFCHKRWVFWKFYKESCKNITFGCSNVNYKHKNINCKRAKVIYNRKKVTYKRKNIKFSYKNIIYIRKKVNWNRKKVKYRC